MHEPPGPLQRPTDASPSSASEQKQLQVLLAASAAVWKRKALPTGHQLCDLKLAGEALGIQSLNQCLLLTILSHSPIDERPY
jgi:hypothetical protein